MTVEAKVVLDSVAPNGARLTTFELTYPRFIHAELMTHRVFSRNAASSRAVPTRKKVERIRTDMARPAEWGVNQKGMQAAGPLPPDVAERAEALWCGLGEEACEVALLMDEMGLHKQVANRVIEPWDHITVVLSTTKLNNHWKLRLEIDEATGRPMADPTYHELGTKWKAAYDASVPVQMAPGVWHRPYYDRDTVFANGMVVRDASDEDLDACSGDLALSLKVSVGRCARVSYMRQGQGDVEENVKLHDRLASCGHWSPFEHVATPILGIALGYFVWQKCDFCREEFNGRGANVRGANVCAKCALGHVTSGNFVGWRQYRKDFPNEAGGD